MRGSSIAERLSASAEEVIRVDPAVVSVCARRPRGLGWLVRAVTTLQERERALADRSARILLVDDEQPIQTLLSYPLRKEGYDVVQATDGRQALDRFEEQPFDLVVLDLMLPRIDGLEICRRLRSRSSVPIIMLTAKSEEIDKVVGLELGADDYSTKPFSLREFSSRIKAALRRAEMSRPVETAPDEVPLVIRELRIDFPKRAVPRGAAEPPP